MLVDVEKRAAVLAVASGFTSDRTNAAMVTENAGPLLAWLEEAGRETPSRRGCLWVIKLWRRLRKADAKADLDARAVAIWQHHLNLTAEEDDNEVVIDNPAGPAAGKSLTLHGNVVRVEPGPDAKQIGVGIVFTE